MIEINHKRLMNFVKWFLVY